MPERSTLGAQIRRRRKERGLTQEQLAERAGVSVDLVSKLEQGKRQTARLSTLRRIAQALDVQISDLVDGRDRLGPDRDGGSLLNVRHALLNPSLLPGLDEADDDGTPTPVDELNRAVNAGWDGYWTGKFGEVLAALPGLIGEARATHSAIGPAAARPLALAYALAADLCTQLKHTDLGLIAAERAIMVAHDGDDPLLWATMYAEYSWVLHHQDRYEEAERVAAHMAERFEPAFSSDDRAIAAWGNLLMTAVAPRVAQGGDPDEYLRLAGAAGERLGRRVPVYHTSFAPVTVAMQATYGYSTLRRPGQALKHAERIRPGDLRGISWGAHLIDVAQARYDAGHRRSAAETLLEAQRVAPAWFRHQAGAEGLIREIRDREQRLTDVTRQLVRAIAIED